MEDHLDEMDQCDVKVIGEGRHEEKIPVESQGVEVVLMEEGHSSYDLQIGHDWDEEDL